jgi:hypothetical protein
VPAGYDLFTDALNGGWHHIACTYDGTTRMRRVYIDGVLKYSDTRTTDLVVPATAFLIGGAAYSNLNYYDGLLDEVMIYTRALKNNEIQRAMTLTLTAYTPLRASTNLVARYSFEDMLNPGKDSGAQGYDLAAFGSVGTAASGKRGRALELSGSAAGYLAWTNSVFPELMPTGNQSMTVSVWINPNTDADTEGSIVFWGNDTVGKGCHLLRLRGGFASGRIGISYTDVILPNLESDAVNGLDRGITPEGWHHIAVVYTDGTRKLYLDGINVAEDGRSGLNVANAFFYIGRKHSSSTWFQGMIDEVEIYNRALSHTEVLELIRDGSDILPAASDLTVAAGATVAINETCQRVAALNGAGTAALRNARLTVDGSGGVFSGALNGDGEFAVRDGAFQTLSGTGTFDGLVVVSNATLWLENSSGTITTSGSAVQIQQGGRLGGGGTIAGTVSFENGAGILAGTEADTLTVDGTVTLGASGTVVLPAGFETGRLTLLNATSLTAPDGLGGWSVEPGQPSCITAFQAGGAQFTVTVFRRGTLISIR